MSGYLLIVYTCMFMGFILGLNLGLRVRKEEAENLSWDCLPSAAHCGAAGSKVRRSLEVSLFGFMCRAVTFGREIQQCEGDQTRATYYYHDGRHVAMSQFRHVAMPRPAMPK